MTDLIVNITDNTGRKHIQDLVEKNEWNNIFIITTQEIAPQINFSGELTVVIVDTKISTEKLVSDLISKFKGNISGLEVALNMFSGTGKEHMAIISALLKLGLGIRLVKQGKEIMEEI